MTPISSTVKVVSTKLSEKLDLVHRPNLYRLKGLDEWSSEKIRELLFSTDGNGEYTPHPPFERVMGSGGTAIVMGRDRNAFRFVFDLLDKPLEDPYREAFLKRLCDFPTNKVPLQVLSPRKPIYITLKTPQGKKDIIVGHSMNLEENTVQLEEYASFARRHKNGVTYQDLTDVLLNLYDLISKLHEEGIVIGELQWKNIGVLPNKEVRLFDALGLQFDGHRCDTFHPEFIDPNLINPDLSIPDIPASKWFLPGRYSVESDRYSFAVIVFRSYTGVHPWKGVYDNIAQYSNLRRARARALQGISVLSPSVVFPLKAVSPEILDGALYDYLFDVFESQFRDLMPRCLLGELKWRWCDKGKLFSSTEWCPCGCLMGIPFGERHRRRHRVTW